MRSGAVQPGVALLALGVLSAPLSLTAQTGDAGADVGLADFAWLEGSWVGEGPQGATAEIHYMAPTAGVLPAFFRLVQGGRVVVLEAVTLRREGDGVFMYVRHFDAALVPLEEEHALRLELVGREGDAFLFENTRPGENPRRSRLERTADGFTSWSELARPDGSADTIFVAWRRGGDSRGAGPAHSPAPWPSTSHR